MVNQYNLIFNLVFKKKIEGHIYFVNLNPIFQSVVTVFDIRKFIKNSMFKVFSTD
ncbi:Uncharacterized protein dnm_074750 [Desulfonema magnum]|uniref:Uncharacterized protein n=1 Tax=Desulfonema magnum TaxID=45655 RepID=A0A975GST1_9BACT|nr:Uncharacterized protein dnm_074750 [Desulfonema magnum]